jgi:DNA-binding SARP family transcriptional activator/ABC-type branched-subunit amino acid transport system substrate-binding protein
VRQGELVAVKVSLTDRVRIEADGAVVEEQRFPGRQGRLVFAYLLAAQGRPVPRDELAEALWGDKPPATWEKALSLLVSKLRALLHECGVSGSDALTSAFGCYQLALPTGTWIDLVAADEAASAAERSLASGEIEQARTDAAIAEALARRTFLPGEDGRWVEDTRADLRETLVRALECLAEAQRLAGDPRAAVRAAEELVELEPYRERGYRLLMKAQSAAGNHAEALRVYERCRRLLDEELGTYPSPETEGIYRELLELPAAQRADSPPVAPPPALPPSHEPPRARRRNLFLVAGGLVLAAGVAVAAVRSSESQGTDLPALQTITGPECSAVHYDGPGAPQLLIAADLPLQPGFLETTTPMANAITLALQRREYTAGPYRVGLQVCDDAPRGNPNDERACKANARTYVASPSVIGVVGPLTSGCALFEIPILNKAPRGAIPIISPSATYVGLTRRVRASDSDEPGSYYPTGQRNFARIIPTDDVQAAAGALVARDLRVRRVYALDMGDPPSTQFVTAFLRAARRLGVSVAGRGSWDLEQASTASIAAAVAKTGADGVFLGVPSVPTSIGLLTALRARLGPGVQLMAPEVFDPEAAKLAGAAAEGMTITQPGPSQHALPPEGREFVAAYTARFGEGPTRFALAAAQATDVMLDAIARSDGSRASVTRSLFKTSVSNGILGSFSITPTGDSTLNAVAVHRIRGGKVTAFGTVIVPDVLVAAG